MFYFVTAKISRDFHCVCYCYVSSTLNLLFLCLEVCLKKSVLKSPFLSLRECVCVAAVFVLFWLFVQAQTFSRISFISLSGWFPQIGPAASAGSYEFDVFNCSLFFAVVVFVLSWCCKVKRFTLYLLLG